MNSKSFWWRLILLPLLPLFAATCGGSGEKNELIVMLDWFPWSNHTGLYQADKAGYYQDEGVSVRIVVPSDPASVLKIVGTGRADFGISYQTDVLQARAEGVPVVAVAALVQHPLNSIMTLKESGITNPKQLEGKKLATPGIPSNDAYLATMMKTVGGDAAKVQKVDVGFDLVPALVSKEADAIIGAYWVHESIVAELQGHPVNIIRVEQFGVPDYYELVLITNETMIAKHPDVVRKFLSATVKGYDDVRRNLDAGVDLLVERAPDTDRRVEERGIKLLAPLWTDGVAKFGQQDPARWQSYGEWMYSHGLLSRRTDWNKAFTNEFLP